MTDEDAYLIDHEYSLDISDQTIEELINFNWPGKFSTAHITYPYLVVGNKNERFSYFSDFNEYLRALNLDGLNSVLLDVEDKGYSTDIKVIIDYFKYVKAKPALFTNVLKGLIQ